MNAIIDLFWLFAVLQGVAWAVGFGIYGLGALLAAITKRLK